jgi:CNT family concentrative nucleoside transporter
MDIYNLISFAGIFVFLFLGWIFSEDKSRVPFRLIGWGLAFQTCFILVLFLFPAGTSVFLWLNGAVVRVLDSASAGARFLFGPLALPPGATGENGEASLGFILAFQAFPSIVFFSALVSLLYFYRVLPFVIRKFAAFFSRILGISGAESLAATSNIFVGVESMLTVRPYMERMTRSELATVLTAGLATVASNVLGLYVFCLKDTFPNIAAHLISASFISIPAAVILSKLLVPERENPETLGQSVAFEKPKEATALEAIMKGAEAGMKLILSISALLLAVLSLVALADLVIGGVGAHLNVLFSIEVDWSLRGLFGYLFYPVTLVLGVPLEDAGPVSRILGERIIVTEVGAYRDLARALAEGALSHPRSAVIASYVLCGFTHVASLSIFVGGAAAIAPKKARELSSLGLRCLYAATLATLVTGSVAGTFLTRQSLLFG